MPANMCFSKIILLMFVSLFSLFCVCFFAFMLSFVCLFPLFANVFVLFLLMLSV